MYKIYINETLLILVNSSKLERLSQEHEIALTSVYRGRPSLLLNVIDRAEKATSPVTIVVHGKDYKKLKKDFKHLYKKIVAAGGLVVNDDGKVLLIFRRGYWDLPKGKMEKDESKKDTAVREVMEETGLKIITLDNKLCKTYHTYKNSSKKRVLKVSHWYLMQANQPDLQPQLEEDIEKAEWVDLEEFLATRGHEMYGNIRVVCEKYLSLV